ncbi:MAG: mandelate racemase/muconate lactonizing enzyme family protein [Rhodoglobus sp.]|uniref:Mandelate racemase/muconate lactonizing enzyme n=1 Tax=marine actinobacterium PHSC20C1 TaxID=312284 RepID=A0ACD6B9J9_9ACTN|nr:Chain A, Mandelate racemase/muconate lactonizing enzyme [marine actinobacterium PHSC20C1]4H83_B Chain B, Mandelate racemase/muconate lactonizing enzyme [marine actinobacterium PHSC20C1]4H83_C Chain C, Mandelate racemase/muconate lactonizing enzyme [marine actinobacterium PHSC20C1]4H83_D Chain D, Mandelate racemase/muconate lactonizing enzyme [marine actinobacterium PHSC20C1]4H83_E Chain E, Mandelate racemase/muconate lactonizing enzyme [marine actinobacterium PHSC20C1]4H83_F Chain F, Mandel
MHDQRVHAERDPLDPQAHGLTITRIETIPMVAPLAREFRGSHYHMTHRATIVTRVHTDAGIIGEAYTGDEHETMFDIDRIIHEELAPTLIGQDAMAIERLWDSGYKVTFDILRDRRLGLVALAAVNTAIWDAVGKALKMPLWKLWGGYRNELPMIAIGGYYGEPLGSIADEMHNYQELGLAGVKFKVGGLSAAEDAARITAAREAAGDDFIICIDANQGYKPAVAVDLSRRIADLNIRWFEEPVEWHNDKRSMRDVRYQGSVPVCAGQTEFSASGCRDLMETGAIDVCNFDSSWSGGPTAWLRTAAIATSYDVQMGHHEEPQVSTHLLASQPHGTIAECFHPDRDPFWWNMITNRPKLNNGTLTLSDRPGLGWDLNWDYIDQYRVSKD